MLLATSTADPEKVVQVEIPPTKFVAGLGINSRSKQQTKMEAKAPSSGSSLMSGSTGWQQERYALCGNRVGAMYSRSGTAISKRTACKACDVSKKNCVSLVEVDMATEAVVPSLLDSEQIVRVPFGSDFKGRWKTTPFAIT